MHRLKDILTFAALVLAGVLVRLAFRDLPNFAPVAAVALFAGFVMTSQRAAVLVPISIMAVSDYFLGLGRYSLPLMATVYGLLAFPALLRHPLRNLLSERHGRTVRLAGLVGTSLGCSLLFFAGTNFMVWATSSWYPHSWEGLADCFIQAVPFFRYTLAGDAIFASVLFGSHALVTHAARSANRQPVAVP